MCIWSKTDNSSGIDGACTRHAQSNSAVSGTFTNINTLLPNYIANCPPRKARTITATEVRQALDGLVGSAASTSTETTLGHFATTNCYGHSGSGACVYYNGAVTSALPMIQQSEWYTNLQAAA